MPRALGEHAVWFVCTGRVGGRGAVERVQVGTHAILGGWHACKPMLGLVWGEWILFHMEHRLCLIDVKSRELSDKHSQYAV